VGGDEPDDAGEEYEFYGEIWVVTLKYHFFFFESPL
jgi:hypothetical protein